MIGQEPAQREDVKTFGLILRANLISDWSTAIDGGAHVGTWAGEMSKHFERVVAFEPTPETFGYLVENMARLPNVECRNEALMNIDGRADMVQPRPKRTALTARYVQPAKRGAIRCATIDGLGLSSCGLIKLDLEGAEALALKGAVRTIKRCKPVLVVEIGGLSRRFGTNPEDLHTRILGLGYREIFRTGVDRIYGPD